MDSNKFKKDILQVIIITPEKNLFDGECKSLSSQNSTGPFDILPEHENFISLINSYINLKTLDGEKKFEIHDAVLKAEANQIHVFVGVESLA